MVIKESIEGYWHAVESELLWIYRYIVAQGNSDW